ncbi:MAG: 30S ribosomal protein S12 methylthiotransferase RimO [Candidatus Acididesulfobacter diazotrophicus]|uniref:Ribosomal protein uS12 methylthiotransferase RimO n=1 Tax=Candidatus Acididesulfobacter diazotrophicus TaxID=2597226 RepID=A0A519BL05_9DELT|nr:MAG: 30S ribosomal protein S12 methylthiotransferase RimO [Candidatus Acididesulfobacter diazotrophicus]
MPTMSTMNNLKFHLISLGCPKNQVDSEDMFTILKKEGLIFNPEISGSDICIVNTCGFLEKARKESIDVIVETINYKLNGDIKHIIVTGCMVNNYKDSLIKELPEVDYFLSTFDESAIADIAKNKLDVFAHTNKEYINKVDLDVIEREHFNLKRTAYLKISEGCGRQCSFCIIPSIRGQYKSKSVEDLKKEVLYLSENGVKELILISQDTSYYGVDNNIKDGLYILLKELIKVKKIKWIRLMYLYPALITDNLISLIKGEEKILKYIDMPVQHISDNVLKLMKRSTDKRTVLRLIEKFKAEIPNIALRTSLIAGFPGETEDDFSELLSFIKETKFDNLGVFKYSDEREAASFKLDNKINVKLKNERYKALMQLQNSLLPEIFSKYIGKNYDAVIDNENSGSNIIKARTYFQAPDIDGCTYIYLENNGGKGIGNNNDNNRSDVIDRIGKIDFLQVKITKQKDYDLYGVIKNNELQLI